MRTYAFKWGPFYINAHVTGSYYPGGHYNNGDPRAPEDNTEIQLEVFALDDNNCSVKTNIVEYLNDETINKINEKVYECDEDYPD